MMPKYCIKKSKFRSFYWHELQIIGSKLISSQHSYNITECYFSRNKCKCYLSSKEVLLVIFLSYGLSSHILFCSRTAQVSRPLIRSLMLHKTSLMSMFFFQWYVHTTSLPTLPYRNTSPLSPLYDDTVHHSDKGWGDNVLSSSHNVPL